MTNSIITTLNDLHVNFSDYVNETTPPAVTDPLYLTRTRYFNRAREDMAKRWFIPSLATNTTLAITAGVASYPMPNDFTRINALRTLQSQDGTTVYTDPFNTITSSNSPTPMNGVQYNGTQLQITRNLTTGVFQLTFNPAPSKNDTLTMIYFGNPFPLVNPTDIVLLDGDACLFFALSQYHMTLGNYTDMSEFRQEYENRVTDWIESELINPAGALTDMQGNLQAKHATDQTQFYQGNTRRNVPM